MVEVTGLLIGSISVPSLLVILSWILVIHTCYIIHKHWTTRFKERKVTSVLTIVSITFFATCMIGCTVHVLNPFAKDPKSHKKMALYIAYMTFTIGRSVMFVLFLGLIHYTFRGTKYDYNKWVKIIYLIPSVLIPLVLVIITTYEKWWFYDFATYKFRRYLDHANTIILCVYSTFLFCRVLGRVAWRQVRTDGSDIEGLKRATRLLNTITRYTVLVLVIIFFAICVMIMDELTWNGITFGIEITEWILILFILYYIDCFINIFCVYLRFAFADPIYDKLCICAHKCCMKMVLGCIKWKYKKFNQDRKTTELSVTTHLETNTNTTITHKTPEADETPVSNETSVAD